LANLKYVQEAMLAVPTTEVAANCFSKKQQIPSVKALKTIPIKGLQGLWFRL
jgi:hypothetical protein